MTQEAILERLIEQGKVTSDRARTAMLGAARGTVVKRLLQNGEITEEDVLAAALSMPETAEHVVVATDTSPHADALMLIPGELARREKVLPLSFENNELTVIIPFTRSGDVQLQDDIKRRAKVRRIRIIMSSTDELERAIEKAYRAEGELRQIATDRAEKEASEASLRGEEIGDIVVASPAVRFVDLVLDQAVTDRASDIHIEQTERNVLVRFRLDGVLHDISANTPKSMAKEIITRIKILSDLDISERRKPQDGRLSINHPKRGKIDFRVAILPTVNGEKIVMRILDNSQASLALKDLGFEDQNLSRFEKAYSKPYGMILVTGPTGSGKSTTLYAALNALAHPGVNIITVEDPVEYKIPRINQVQVENKAGMTFAGALRSILRADPDIILIGEIRDKETARIAIEAAQTGHLVLSTLHTNDAPSAVGRLVDLGVEPFLVGNVLESVLAQRLIRRLCKHCKTTYTPEPEDLKSLAFPWTEGSPLPILYKPVGCKECAGTGYRGRMAIHEVMAMTPTIEKIIVRDGTSVDIAEQAKADGMQNLRQDGWVKVSSGETSIQEILRVVA